MSCCGLCRVAVVELFSVVEGWGGLPSVVVVVERREGLLCCVERPVKGR